MTPRERAGSSNEVVDDAVGKGQRTTDRGRNRH